MAEYRIGDRTFSRKNLYVPCIIGARFDSMTEAEKASAYKAAYWADNITNAEWPLVLRHDGVKAYVRSRFKKKAAGWLMALARVALINPDLFAEIATKADEMYREQIEDDSLLLQTVRMLAEQTVAAHRLLKEDDVAKVVTNTRVFNEVIPEDEEAAA
jgi:hypothetical protein